MFQQARRVVFPNADAIHELQLVVLGGERAHQPVDPSASISTGSRFETMINLPIFHFNTGTPPR